MKKIIFICAIALLSAPAFAQSFNFGIKAGVNTSKLTSDFTDENNLTGYDVGVFARLGGLGLYVQPELYLGSKGTNFTSVKADENGTEVNASQKVKFTTLDFPVLLGTKIGLPGIGIRLNAGPVVSFNLDKDAPFSAAYDDLSDFKNYKNNAWGLLAGAGVDISKITLDIRYEAGLSNISESEKYDQKANLWHFTLGYKIF
ncbi:outer membrane beta-barrel protein [Pedobacter sp. HMF7647]|uniref:Outer membrane beta-barrel protein n=1 Tax=Hufsiella arboris TaxID=2695275 RepID=A0A7K1Y672_9SPHI|nr:porin family protein [Hufsiella arboris]MXV49528.1 outer membrane beta-barrel protein [Hufsiella arboris]